MNAYKLLYNLGAHKLFYSLKSLNKKKVTVLCFHRVSDQPDFFWQPLRVSDFEKIIQYCVRNYQIISLSQLHLGVKDPSGKPLMAITFDDGYKDFLINALPILKKHNIPANHNVVVDCVDGKQNIWTQDLNSIFNFCRDQQLNKKISIGELSFDFSGINTDWKKIYFTVLFHLFKLDKEKRSEWLNLFKEKTGTLIQKEEYMSWDDLKICRSSGIEIGSHSLTHDVLDTIKDPKDLMAEISTSKEIIESKLNEKINTLAFPNGKYNTESIELAKKVGYQNILLTDDKIYVHQENDASSLLIPRLSVYDGEYYAEILRIENFQNTLKKILGR